MADARTTSTSLVWSSLSLSLSHTHTHSHGRRAHDVDELGVVPFVVALDLLHRARARFVWALHVLAAVLQHEAFEERVEGGADLAGLLNQRVDVLQRFCLLGRRLLARGQCRALRERAEGLEEARLVALSAVRDELGPCLEGCIWRVLSRVKCE